MLGVVLWSDSSDNKAVIWCEDHGNLAYYNGGAQPYASVFEFDAGDLIQFDLTEEQHLRLASNPRRVGEQVYPHLAEDLKTAGKKKETGIRLFGGADVIPFMRRPRQPRETARCAAG